MASFNSILTTTLISAADYSSTPYRLVYVSAADTVTRCTDASAPAQRPIGILTDEVGSALGDPVSVQLGGIAKLEAGAAIAAGEAVCTESDGKGVATTTAADFCVGIALEAASGDGVIFSVAMLPHTYTA